MWPRLQDRAFQTHLQLCSKNEMTTEKRDEGMDHQIIFKFDPRKPGLPRWMYDLGRHILNLTKAQELYRESIEGEPNPGEKPKVTLKVKLRAQYDTENPWLKKPGTLDTSMEKIYTDDSREYHRHLHRKKYYKEDARPKVADFQVEHLGRKNPFPDMGYILEQEVFPDLLEYRDVRRNTTVHSMDYFPPMAEMSGYLESQNTNVPNYQVELEGIVIPFEDKGYVLTEDVFPKELNVENFVDLVTDYSKLTYPGLLEMLKWEIDLTNRFYYIPEKEKKLLLERIKDANLTFDDSEKQRIIHEIYATISRARDRVGMTEEMDRDTIVKSLNNNFFRFDKTNYDRALEMLEILIEELNDGDLSEGAFLDKIYSFLYYLDVYEKPDQKGSEYKKSIKTFPKESAQVATNTTRDVSPALNTTRGVRPAMSTTRGVGPALNTTRGVSTALNRTRDVGPALNSTRDVSPALDRTRDVSLLSNRTRDISSPRAALNRTGDVVSPQSHLNRTRGASPPLGGMSLRSQSYQSRSRSPQRHSRSTQRRSRSPARRVTSSK